MDNLNYEEFQKGIDGALVGGVCLIQTYQKQPTKTGGTFIGGKLSTKEGTIDFKAWSSSNAYKCLSDNEMVGKCALIAGGVNIYNGMKSIVLQSAVEVENANPLDYMLMKYNVDAYYEKLHEIMRKNCSENGYKVFDMIISKHAERFKHEFAATFHHDACVGGLLAHTFKMCQMISMVRIYPNISNKVSRDLLYVGCALHDIGKIYEYENGSLSHVGEVISHTTLGIPIIEEFHDNITDLMGEEFFCALMSIISGHHGEYGEPPRTVVAYVIHLIDLLESTLEGLDKVIEGSDSDIIRYSDFKLR